MWILDNEYTMIKDLVTIGLLETQETFTSGPSLAS